MCLFTLVDFVAGRLHMSWVDFVCLLTWVDFVLGRFCMGRFCASRFCVWVDFVPGRLYAVIMNSFHFIFIMIHYRYLNKHSTF